MKSSIKLSVIIPSFYPAVVYGGWVFSSFNTCKELAALGTECYVSTTNDNGKNALPPVEKSYKKLFDNIFVKYYKQNIKERFSLSMVSGLYKDIKGCDIVHVQGIFSAPSPLGLFFANLLGKKTILSPHGCLGEWCLSDGSSSFKRPYLYFFIRPFAHKITWHVTSDQEEQEVKALYPKAKTIIIPNGIYAEEFAQPNRLSRADFIEKYTGITNCQNKVIISMARLHKKKGLDILIDAFTLTLKTHPQTTLLIAGEDFGEGTALMAQIERLQLKNKVFLVGQIEGQERVDFFANADLFALSSHNENFGLVYAEAMAAGTPILASTNTPWKEVEDLGIGKWVSNTAEDTAKGLNEMLSKNLQELGELSKTFVVKKYTWKSIGIQFYQLFEALLSKK